MMHTLYVSTAGFKPLKTLPATLSYLAEAGITHVELSGGLAPYEGSLVALLDHWKRKAGFRYIVHNYFPVPPDPFLLNIASSDDATWKRSVEFCEEALRLSAAIGSPVYGVHAGYAGVLRDRGDGYFFPDENPVEKDWSENLARCYERMLETVRHLAPLADRLGVRLCVENLFPMTGIPPQLMTGPREWRRFVRDTEGLGVGLVIDLAHMHIAEVLGGESYREALAWVLGKGRPHVFQLHLSHNEGRWDSHDPIGPGSWVLRSLSEGAASHGWPEVPVTYESRGLSREHLQEILPLIRSSMRGTSAVPDAQEGKA